MKDELYVLIIGVHNEIIIFCPFFTYRSAQHAFFHHNLLSAIISVLSPFLLMSFFTQSIHLFLSLPNFLDTPKIGVIIVQTTQLILILPVDGVVGSSDDVASACSTIVAKSPCSSAIAVENADIDTAWFSTINTIKVVSYYYIYVCIQITHTICISIIIMILGTGFSFKQRMQWNTDEGTLLQYEFIRNINL